MEKPIPPKIQSKEHVTSNAFINQDNPSSTLQQEI